MLTAILTIIGTLIPTILQNAGVIGASTNNLISSLLIPIEALIGNLKNSQNATQSGLAALGAAAGVIAVLKATTGLPADVLTQINSIDLDVQAALIAYVKAGSGFDISVYTVTPEV